MKNVIVFLGAVLFLSQGVATTVELPEDELAQESVHPVFDHPTAVKRRNVNTAGRFEINAFGGFFLNDAFFSPITIGGAVTYHNNESSGIQLYGGYFTRTISQYGDQIKNTPGVSQDYSRAPSVKYLLLAAYEWTPFYGKISVTKRAVMNLAVSFTGGLGALGYGDETLPSLGGGVTQKFYFGEKWGLFADLKGLIYQGPNVVSKNLPPTGNSTVLSNSEFEKKLHLNFLFNVGAIFLL